MKKWIVELLKKVFQLLLAVVLAVAVCTVAFSHRKVENLPPVEHPVRSSLSSGSGGC